MHQRGGQLRQTNVYYLNNGLLPTYRCHRPLRGLPVFADAHNYCCEAPSAVAISFKYLQSLLRLLRRYAPRNDTEDNNIVIARHQVPWRSLSNTCNPCWDCFVAMLLAMTRKITILSSRGTKCRGDLFQIPAIPVWDCFVAMLLAMTRVIASLYQTRAMSSRGTKCRGDLFLMPAIPVW